MGVIIKKDGIYFNDWVYDEEKEEGQDVEKRVNFLEYLNEKVEELEEGMTFREFVRAFYPGGFTIETMAIMDLLTDRRLTEFLKELDQDPPADEWHDDDPLVRLEIYVAAEGNKWRKSNQYELGIYLGIHGFGTKVDHEHGIKGTIPYAISYSHWGTFANLPITLNTKTVLTLTDETRKRNWLKPWKKPRRHYTWKQIDIEYQPTLIELIHDVFTDLAFCGSPENRSAHNDELMRRKEEIDNGTAELVPFNIDEFLDEED